MSSHFLEAKSGVDMFGAATKNPAYPKKKGAKIQSRCRVILRSG